MKFTQDMMLQSDSGYCMPFEEKGKDVEMSLGYWATESRSIPRQGKCSSITESIFQLSTICFLP